LKRYRESAKMYLSYAEQFPDSPSLRLSRFSAALCLEELDDWRGAIEIYEQISDDEAEFRRAICLERSGRPDESAQIFEGFLERFAESPEMLKVRFRLGSMRMRQGRIDEAIRHLAETVRLGGDTFIGQLATQLIEKARAKAADTARKLKSYS
ncbi:MAG: tetratricopeptide repeat protein, partial [Candidatus Hydrogenedentota bacterium]